MLNAVGNVIVDRAINSAIDRFATRRERKQRASTRMPYRLRRRPMRRHRFAFGKYKPRSYTTPYRRRMSSGPGGTGRRGLRARQFASARSGGGRVIRYRSLRSRFKRRRLMPRWIRRGVKAMIKKNEMFNNGLNTRRNVDSGQLSVDVNKCSYEEHVLLQVTQIETALSTSTAATYDQVLNQVVRDDADLTATSSVRTKILSYVRNYTLRNNGQMPVDIEIFQFHWKKRAGSSIKVLTEFKNGLADKGYDTTADAQATDLRLNLYDSPMVKRWFKQYKYRKYRLQAGDEVHFQVRRNKPFMYDPDEYDHHTDSHRNPHFTQSVVFRMQGIVTHDDTNTNQVGTGDAKVDWIYKDSLKWVVDGAPFHSWIETGSGALDSQAAGARAAGPVTGEEKTET